MINTALRPLLRSRHPASKAKEKGGWFGVERAEEDREIRWKRVLSILAFESPATKFLSPIIGRAQWEVTINL